MSFVPNVRKLLAELGEGPLFVHSDPFRTAHLVSRPRNRSEFLDEHIALLKNVAADRDLWIPSFNYDFPRTHVFNVLTDEAQVGPIPEQFRTTAAEWRTPMPFFSVSGLGAVPEISWGKNTDPFGDDAIFAKLVASDGVLLYYGDTFSYNTLVHYAERQSGGPAYRYDKLFRGRVVMRDGTSVPGSVCYHVRPLNRDLDYDWAALLESALAAGVCRRVDGNPEVLAASARDLSELWIAALATDPLTLLDERSRAWVAPALARLGRRFTIGDFEHSDVILPPT